MQTVSIKDLFLGADIVVQLIIVLLLVASIACWTVIFSKYWALRNARINMTSFEEMFWSGISLDEISQNVMKFKSNPISRVYLAAMAEWEQSKNEDDKMLAQIERSMNLALQKEEYKMQNHMSLLANIGSASPFIGLLGTVWGIMNSFNAIGITNQTSLAVVAPGISEALFATALGLFAAIPATIAYNRFYSEISKISGRVESFSTEFMVIMARNI